MGNAKSQEVAPAILKSFYLFVTYVTEIDLFLFYD